MDKVQQTAAYIKEKFAKEGTGHDWFHIERVWKVAHKIAEEEGADLFVTDLAALLHDIADHKFHNNSLEAGPEAATQWLKSIDTDPQVIHKVVAVMRQVSYKGAGVKTPVSTLEAAAVQDADRLDAIGAIGIGRAFAYGGSKNRLMYHPDHKPHLHDSFETYTTDEGTTINHFYEKLLLLKDRMNTNTGKRIAEERHAFMEKFLEQFYKEWEGR